MSDNDPVLGFFFKPNRFKLIKKNYFQKYALGCLKTIWNQTIKVNRNVQSFARHKNIFNLILRERCLLVIDKL